ncbi:hypothetical protein HD806DRAFT_538263 [Xylariaceae sp. AK1471]|nr:hypothetical protein HD806DRAFT_538263 [Xylariaceae sp. AK1471]
MDEAKKSTNPQLSERQYHGRLDTVASGPAYSGSWAATRLRPQVVIPPAPTERNNQNTADRLGSNHKSVSDRSTSRLSTRQQSRIPLPTRIIRPRPPHPSGLGLAPSPVIDSDSDSDASTTSYESDTTDFEVTTPDTSQIGNSQASISLAPASPSLSSASDDNRELPPSGNFLLNVRSGNSPQRRQDLDIDVSDSSVQSPCDNRDLNIARAPIQGLGVPEIALSQAGSLEPNPVIVACERRLTDRKRSVGKHRARRHHKSLHDRIHNALQQTSNNRSKGETFLPIGQLDDLLTIDAVVRELNSSLRASSSRRQYSSLQLEEFANIICYGKVFRNGSNTETKRFQKIFAILVLVEQSSSFPLFLDGDLSDETLPLKLVPSGKTVQLRQRDSSSLDGIADKKLRCFHGWSQRRIRLFWEDQWKMLVRFFDQGDYNDVPHYDLEDQAILPFVPTEDGRGQISLGHGGFGDVFITHIHPAHHNFQDPSYYRLDFAIKELFRGEKDEIALQEFQQEVNILKKFKGDRRHPHIVTLLATYKQFNRYHLIFYRADGNLFNYWKSINPNPVMDYTNCLWVVQQFEGLVDGLSHLHYHETFRKNGDGEDGKGDKICKYGRHKDIKPENILWYDGPEGSKGTLKLSDFGASDLKSHESKSMSEGNGPDTLTYRPPERELNYIPIRQSADIWSLGCVFMEFVVWALGGSALLYEDFAIKRLRKAHRKSMEQDTFFWFEHLQTDEETGIVKGNLMIKEAVAKYFDELHAHANCTDLFHRLLNMIRYDMLVVEQENFEQQRRKSSKEIAHKLKSLHEECLQNPDIATKKEPWNEMPRNFDGHSRGIVEVCYTMEASHSVTQNSPPPRCLGGFTEFPDLGSSQGSDGTLSVQLNALPETK